MIDWNKPVRTKCGKPVRVVYRNRKALDGRTKLLLIDRGGGYEYADFADDQGRGDRYTYKNVPEKRAVWINVYPNKLNDYFFRSAKAADKYAASNRIACVRVEYEIPAVEVDDD